MAKAVTTLARVISRRKRARAVEGRISWAVPDESWEADDSKRVRMANLRNVWTYRHAPLERSPFCHLPARP